jgi:hypothetical protein
MAQTAQYLITITLVLAAVGYLGRRAWRSTRSGCGGGGCSCSGAKASQSPAGPVLIPKEQLTLRRRDPI